MKRTKNKRLLQIVRPTVIVLGVSGLAVFYKNAIAAGLFLLLLAAVYMMIISVIVLTQKYRHWGLVRGMTERGRYIPWRLLEARLLAGEGTLIVEQANKERYRIWWTEDYLAKLSPYVQPAEEALDYLKLSPPDLFVSWCLTHYLDRDTGKAFLTDPPFDYPPGFIGRKYFLDKFPISNVVMTVKLT